MKRAFVAAIICALVPFVSGQIASAQSADAPAQWRALGARAGGFSFSTSLSGKKPTEREAIETMLSFCKQQGNAGCTLVATFSSGCRYVMLGGRQVGPKELKPVFFVGNTQDEARQKCVAENLVCNREPQGGCID
jgi:hypothetical protein